MLKKKLKSDGLRVQVAYVETLDTTLRTDKKTKASYEIQEKVYKSLADSVADNAKLISLMFIIGSSIYEALGDEIKEKIPSNVREKIEHAIEKFKSIETWGSIQINKEGNEAIDKLLQRQAQIGKIIKDIYEIKD